MIDFETDKLESLTPNKLKRVADYWLRQYLLRTTKKVNGNYLCPLTEKYLPENRMNVSHFIDRAVMATRYDLENVHLISDTSNMWDSKIITEEGKTLHHKMYEEWLGEEVVARLLEKSKERKIFKKEDYINLINKFKNE